MIPDKSSPIWKDLVTERKIHEFKSVPGGMLMTRLVTKCKIDSSQDTLIKAVQEAHAFFEKYQAILKDDISKLFR